MSNAARLVNMLERLGPFPNSRRITIPRGAQVEENLAPRRPWALQSVHVPHVHCSAESRPPYKTQISWELLLQRALEIIVAAFKLQRE
jgi:hypothetical protein